MIFVICLYTKEPRPVYKTVTDGGCVTELTWQSARERTLGKCTACIFKGKGKSMTNTVLH